MRVKPWATFTTSLPDDQVEEEHDIVPFGGRNVAVAIGEVFTGLGCKVEEPYSVEEQGWEFLVSYRGHMNFSCRVCSFHPEFRLLFEELSLRPKAFRNPAGYAQLAQSFAAALGEDPRFRDITWWTLDEGPPEPDDVGSIRAGKGGNEDPRRPIAIAGKRRFVPAWIWLTLGVWMLLTAAIGLHFWFSEFRSGDFAPNDLAFGLFALSVGGLALRGAIRRGVFK
jgi:hypothetical protein